MQRIFSRLGLLLLGALLLAGVPGLGKAKAIGDFTDLTPPYPGDSW